MLTDIATQSLNRHTIPLSWVGMHHIQLPMRIGDASVLCDINLGVNLDQAEQRGIHMSRLYLLLQHLENQEISPVHLRDLLHNCLNSHSQLSSTAKLQLASTLHLKQSALRSDLAGWAHYPIKIHAQLKDGCINWQVDLSVTYSSTCPCSAALSRQVLQDNFKRYIQQSTPSLEQIHYWLGQETSVSATPHSQRSFAHVSLRLTSQIEDFDWHKWIGHIEASLGTPVQTAVKRIDEQAFAIANGQNLMFCEDAARRIYSAIKPLPNVDGFKVQVIHAESLHAHDAVAECEFNWR